MGCLNENPRFDSKVGFNKMGTYVFGDMHANTWKLISLLVTTGFLEIEEDVLTKIHSICDKSDEQKLTKEDFKEFEDLLKVKKGPNSTAEVVFIGDLIADRRGNDGLQFMTLYYLSLLGIKYRAPMSNHDLEAIINIENGNLLNNPSKVKTSMDDYCMSLFALAESIQDGVVDKTDVELWIQKYLSHLKLLTYRISKEGFLTVLNHTDIDEDTIYKMAKQLGVNPLKETPGLVLNIDNMNVSFEQYKATKRISSLYQDEYLESENPFYDGVWNRNSVFKKYDSCIHGHNETDEPLYDPENKSVTATLDGQYGKVKERDGQEGSFFVYHIEGEEKNRKIPNVTFSRQRNQFEHLSQEVEKLPNIEDFFNSKPNIEAINLLNSKLIDLALSIHRLKKGAKLYDKSLYQVVKNKIKVVDGLQEMLQQRLEVFFQEEINGLSAQAPEAFSNFSAFFDYKNSHLKILDSNWARIKKNLSNHLILSSESQQGLLEQIEEKKEDIDAWRNTDQEEDYKAFKEDLEIDFVAKVKEELFFSDVDLERLNASIRELKHRKKVVNNSKFPQQEHSELLNIISTLLEKANVIKQKWLQEKKEKIEIENVLSHLQESLENSLYLFDAEKNPRIRAVNRNTANGSLDIIKGKLEKLQSVMNEKGNHWDDMKQKVSESFEKIERLKTFICFQGELDIFQLIDFNVLSETQLDEAATVLNGISKKITDQPCLTKKDQTYFQEILEKISVQVESIRTDWYLCLSALNMETPCCLGDFYKLLGDGDFVVEDALQWIEGRRMVLKILEEDIASKGGRWNSVKEELTIKINQLQELEEFMQEVLPYEDQLVQLKKHSDSLFTQDEEAQTKAKSIQAFLEKVLDAKSLSRFKDAVQNTEEDLMLFKRRRSNGFLEPVQNEVEQIWCNFFRPIPSTTEGLISVLRYR